MDDADGVEDFLPGSAFEEVAFGAGPDGAEDAIVGVEDGEDDDAYVAVVVAKRFQDSQPVHFRHLEVEKEDVGGEGGDVVEGFVAVAGLADDFEVILRVEDGDEAVAYDGVVVGDEDADRFRHRANRSGR